MQETLVTQEHALNCIENDFQSEKHFCDYIETNIEAFCNEDLNVDIFRYKRECRPDMNLRLGNRGRKVDFFIQSKCGQNILIECKHPKNSDSELSSAIGQILSYKAECNLNNIRIDRVIICTTKLSKLPLLTIEENKLPIEIICMDKSKRIRVDLNHLNY